MKRVFFLIILMGFMVLHFQNCASHNDPSLFEYAASSATSDPQDVILESPQGTIDVSIYESMISVGGNCQVGDSASHYIELKLQDQNNQPIKLRSSITCPDCYTLVNARCEHGKYNAVIPVTCEAYRSANSSLYRLSAQLVTKDAQGNETRDSGATFDRFLQIAWVTGACPL